MREEWIRRVVAEHQTLLPLLSGDCTPSELSALCLDTYRRVLPVHSHVEDVILRYLAIQLALRCSVGATETVRLIAAFSNEPWPSILEMLTAIVHVHDATVWKVKQYVDQNCTRSSFRSVDIATVVHGSPGAVKRLFREKFGCTARQYVELVRTKKALQRMSDTDEKVFGIALAAGFGSVSSFERAVRKLGVKRSHRRRLTRQELATVLARLEDALASCVGVTQLTAEASGAAKRVAVHSDQTSVHHSGKPIGTTTCLLRS